MLVAAVESCAADGVGFCVRPKDVVSAAVPGECRRRLNVVHWNHHVDLRLHTAQQVDPQISTPSKKKQFLW